jgi:hypothetical protein
MPPSVTTLGTLATLEPTRMEHNVAQHNETQHNETQHKDAQHIMTLSIKTLRIMDLSEWHSAKRIWAQCQLAKHHLT